MSNFDSKLCTKLLLNSNEDPTDLDNAKHLINELRQKCRTQAEQLMAWRKAYNLQRQQHFHEDRNKVEQLNALTSQLLLLESRIKRKQNNIANILCQKELTILRQQKLIDALSSRLVDHGLDSVDPGGCYTDFDSLNDSDSAVVLEDIDSDCNTSYTFRRKSCGSSMGGGGGGGGGGIINSGMTGIGSTSDVTIVRSISDAIDTKVIRRSTCYLRRPENVLETVYSVEEDPEPDVVEKRDKFKNRSEKIIMDFNDDSPVFDICSESSNSINNNISNTNNYSNINSNNNDYNSNSSNCQLANNCSKMLLDGGNCKNSKQQTTTQVTNYNRVMSNHRSVTKPKDVKYKRINKAKSKSLEELRGRLKHWVEKGNNFDAQNQQYQYDFQQNQHQLPQLPQQPYPQQQQQQQQPQQQQQQQQQHQHHHKRQQQHLQTKSYA